MGHRRSKKISARLNPDNDIDRCGAIVGSQGINRFAEAIPVFQQRGDVVEIDARLGEVRHFADKIFQIGGHAAIVASALGSPESPAALLQ